MEEEEIKRKELEQQVNFNVTSNSLTFHQKLDLEKKREEEMKWKQRSQKEQQRYIKADHL